MFLASAWEGLDKSSEDVQQMLREADKDGNGTIELHEFLEFITSLMGKTNVSHDTEVTTPTYEVTYHTVRF